jgi:hypothetical protein
MINQAELRIGNLIGIAGDDGLIEYGYVQKTESAAFKEWNDSRDFIPYLPVDADSETDFWETDSPIFVPLTEEWLTRFGLFDIQIGFVFGEDSPYYVSQLQNGNFGLFMLRDGFYLKEIPCVHDLQNLYFALTGEELQKKDKQ